MKRFLPLLLIALASSNAVAQYRTETKFGLRLGANYSELETNFIEDPAARIAPAVIFFAEVPLGKTFSLVPELGFSALGANEDRVPGFNGNADELKINYLTGTLLAQINITRFLYLNAGGQLALNVSENDENDYYDEDYQALGGIGIKLSEELSIDARYGYGFNNVFEGDLGAQGFNAENRFFQLTLSYRM